jgi:signal transduction histidine kinase
MNGNTVRILLIEDNRGDARLIREALAETGSQSFHLEHVETLGDGRERLKKGDINFVLLDLSLPDSHGIETFIRLHAHMREIPIVIMSGMDDETLALEAVQKGAQDYLVKGQTDGKLLYRVIRYALERKRLEQTKDEFVRTVSHELRTPMTIIREGVSQIQSELLGPISEQQKHVLNITLKGIDRLRRIIDNLLDIAKIEAGKLKLEKDKIDLVDLIKGVCVSFRTPIEKKGLELRSKVPDHEVYVSADRDKIIQVLTNLIGNAVKFTESGYIEVSLNEYEDFVECCVQDTGVGIQKENQLKVFDKFEQTSRQAGPGEKGTGLGLAISKNLIELHDGKIWVESEFGKGSKFIFTLSRLMEFAHSQP